MGRKRSRSKEREKKKHKKHKKEKKKHKKRDKSSEGDETANEGGDTPENKTPTGRDKDRDKTPELPDAEKLPGLGKYDSEGEEEKLKKRKWKLKEREGRSMQEKKRDIKRKKERNIRGMKNELVVERGERTAGKEIGKRGKEEERG